MKRQYKNYIVKFLITLSLKCSKELKVLPKVDCYLILWTSNLKVTKLCKLLMVCLKKKKKTLATQNKKQKSNKQFKCS